jgi:hypothetical protein
MFICKGYNGSEVDNVSAIYNGWKLARKKMIGYRTQSFKVG